MTAVCWGGNGNWERGDGGLDHSFKVSKGEEEQVRGVLWWRSDIEKVDKMRGKCACLKATEKESVEKVRLKI